MVFWHRSFFRVRLTLQDNGAGIKPKCANAQQPKSGHAWELMAGQPGGQRRALGIEI